MRMHNQLHHVEIMREFCLEPVTWNQLSVIFNQKPETINYKPFVL